MSKEEYNTMQSKILYVVSHVVVILSWVLNAGLFVAVIFGGGNIVVRVLLCVLLLISLCGLSLCIKDIVDQWREK